MSKFKKLLKVYEEKYKDLPDEDEDLLEYVLTTYKVDENKLNAAIESIDQIQWKTVEFDLPVIPNPAPRPRHTQSGRTYVEGAKETKDFFREYVNSRYNDHVFDLISEIRLIHTVVDIHLDLYIPTPVSSMSKIEVVLAQMKKIRPIGNGDWDNLAKTYCDMIQDILIYNDNIIASGSVDKYYSIKPKVHVVLKYQTEFDSNYNRRKVTGSIGYKKIMID